MTEYDDGVDRQLQSTVHRVIEAQESARASKRLLDVIDAEGLGMARVRVHFRRKLLQSAAAGLVAIGLGMVAVSLFWGHFADMPMVTVIASCVAFFLGAGQIVFVWFQSVGLDSEAESAMRQLKDVREAAEAYDDTVESALQERITSYRRLIDAPVSGNGQ